MSFNTQNPRSNLRVFHHEMGQVVRQRAHPQRVRDNRIDGNAADGSQHAFRVRGEQGFTGSIEKHRARRPIVRESIKERITFGPSLRPHGFEISR